MPRLADFAGAWRLERLIVGAGRGAGRLSGHAWFRSQGAELVYDEEGELRLSGLAPLRAVRRYRWRGEPVASVRFADGAPFHRLDLRLPAPQAEHRCGDDLYRVAYDFTAWPHWSATWAVRGPGKDYRLISRYAPAGACMRAAARAEPHPEAREGGTRHGPCEW